MDLQLWGLFFKTVMQSLKNTIYCVSNDYITEQVYRENFYTKLFDHSESSSKIWNRNISAAGDSTSTSGGTTAEEHQQMEQPETIIQMEPPQKILEPQIPCCCKNIIREVKTWIKILCCCKNPLTDSSGNARLKEPNPIDFSHFVVDVNPSDLKDRIYLDNVVLNSAKDKNSCNFY